MSTTSLFGNLTTSVKTIANGDVDIICGSQVVGDLTVPGESTVTNLNIQNGIAEGSLRSVGAAIEDAEYSLGENAVALGSSNKSSGNASHAEGGYNIAKGACSHAEGNQTQANGHYSHTEGQLTTANAMYSHAEGHSTIATGQGSHTEGYKVHARGDYSHAEGSRTNSWGDFSHAEGGVYGGTYKLVVSGEANATSYTTTDTTQYYGVGRKFLYGTDTIVTVTNVSGQTITFDKTLSSEALVDAEITYIYGAYGDYSHSEGYGTVTDDHSAHAEGYATSANIKYSHAEGQCTVANAPAQHVQGRFNVVDNNNKYAHIVGNGTSDPHTRSNAHTLDWDGNAWFAGDVYVGGSSQDDSTAIKLVKVSDLNAAIANLRSEMEGLLSGQIIGVVDENNNIILTGDLAAGTYTLKYEDEDGGLINIGSFVCGDASFAVPITWIEDKRTQMGTGSVSYGGEFTSEDYAVSELISLKDGYIYTVYGENLSGKMSCYAIWYTDNGGAIASGSISDGDGWNVSTSGNTSFVLNPPDGAGMFRLQSYCTDFTELSKVTVEADADSTKKYGDAVSIVWSVGDKLDKTDGTIESTGTNYSASDFISIANKTYTVHMSAIDNAGLSLVFYDSNKNFVSYASNVISETVLDYEITPPTNAVYMRLRAYTGSADNAWRYKLIYLTETV